MVNIVFQDGPLSNLTYVSLKNIVMSAGVFTRFLSMVIQTPHYVICTLDSCKIESEEDVRQMAVEMENQSGLQMVAPLPASPDYRTHITLKSTTLSAGMFRRFVSMVIQVRYSVNCMLKNCIIESEEDMTQMAVEMENQPGLQMVGPLPASPDYKTDIAVITMPMSAGMFRRFASMVIQARHYVKCRVDNCTIESEDDVRQMEVEMENQSGLQMVGPLPASPDYKIDIALTRMTMSAGVFRRLASMVIQARHSVNCTLDYCKIESEMDVRQMAVEMENQPGLQMVAPLPTDYSTNITLKLTTLSAEMFRRFVNMVIKARHSVICTLDYCTIKEDIRQVKAEMENQPLLKVREFNEKTAGGFREIWVICFTVNI
ncbi:uncharacterized protein LOC128228944 [Mya arenaria]|uniref:uncharacterized protein LOC128228944 n=1 Tax=Mya arenaria TaxID=6604 RepID=UPI0022E1939A|nr:uncharacterized protein LOC128228944 [Mya arenaria]